MKLSPRKGPSEANRECPMRRTILLLRHAKSSWDDTRQTDFDRPLAARGRLAATLMGAYLAEERLIPDRVLCSSAARTRETWRRASVETGRTIPVDHLDSLYEAAPAAILRELSRLDNSVAYVLVVGHNPGMEMVADQLVGDGVADARRRLAGKFPTAGLAVIDAELVEWDDIRPGCGRLLRFLTPKDLV